ncbi:angiopoietin-like protein 8 isoform X1 [Monodelphis domestica]|uniref:angiopoietin-like protein 8 isoform X1 n=1 Tax=Monodelphis domestica TaxID=13616 RepID=UPI0007B40E75|nr:angiopoietin-like protein 8 isoform X1 [Monodelphis domestica]
MSLLLLCLFLMPSLALPMPTPPQLRQEPALQDEVNILFHGVLQFGQALSRIYKATEAKLDEASRSLGFYEQTVVTLQQDLGSARARTQELERSLGEIQAEEESLGLETQGAGIALSQVMEGHQALWQRVEKLHGALATLGSRHTPKELEELKAQSLGAPILSELKRKNEPKEDGPRHKGLSRGEDGSFPSLLTQRLENVLCGQRTGLKAGCHLLAVRPWSSHHSPGPLMQNEASGLEGS